MGIYLGTTRINSVSMALYINRIYKGDDLVFGGGSNITYKPFVVDRRGIYNLDLAVGNRGIENWRMTSLATQITNPGATSGTTADPQDAVRSSVEVTMQREYERGFRRFTIRTPMGARTKGNVDPYGTALSSASWSAGDPNLGTWNDAQNIATVKSGGATLEYVFTTTGERKSVDATAATADRQQSFINFMKPWIDSKAAAGDPVQVYIYDGYQLAFHDTAQTDPAKGNLAMKGSWESGWTGDTAARFPRPDFSIPSHVQFRENEVIPWRDQVGIKGFMVDAASNAGDTAGAYGIARAPGYFEFYRDRGLDIMGEAVPVILGAGGTYDLNPDLYKLTPYVGYGGGTADGLDGNFWGNRNWRTIFPSKDDSEIHMVVQWAWQGATGGINSEYWNGATYDWAGITAEIKQAHDNGFVIDAGFGPTTSAGVPSEEAKRYIVLDYIAQLGGGEGATQDRRPMYAEAYGSARSEINVRERWGVASIGYRKTPLAGASAADFNDPQKNGRLLWVDNQTKDLIPLGYARFSFTNIQGWTTYDSGGSNAVVYQPHYPSNPYSGLRLTEAKVFTNLTGTTWDVSPTPFTNNGSNGFSDPDSIAAGTPGDNIGAWTAAITYLRNELSGATSSVALADQQIVAYAGYRPTYTDITMTGIDRTLLGVSSISNRGGDGWSGEGESPAYTPDVGFDGERPEYSYSVEAFDDWWGFEVNGIKSLGFDTIGLDTGTNMYMNSAGMYNTGVGDKALAVKQGNTILHNLFTSYGVRTFTEAVTLNYSINPKDPVPWTRTYENNDIAYTAGAAWALFGSWWGYVGADKDINTYGTSGTAGIIGEPVGGKVWYNNGKQQIGEFGSPFNINTTEIHCVFQWNDQITSYATAKVIAQTNGWTALKQIMYDFHQAGVIVSVGGVYYMTNGGYLEGGTGNRITSSDFFGFVQDLANGQIVQRP